MPESTEQGPPDGRHPPGDKPHGGAPEEQDDEAGDEEARRLYDLGTAIRGKQSQHQDPLHVFNSRTDDLQIYRGLDELVFLALLQGRRKLDVCALTSDELDTYLYNLWNIASRACELKPSQEPAHVPA